jgi:hypothetical protein
MVRCFTFMAVHASAVLALAALNGPVAHAASNPEDAPAWVTGADGVRYRVRFDPGERVLVGLGASATPSVVAPALDVGLLLRSRAPEAGWEVFWKRQHEIARATLRLPGEQAPAHLTAVLYRGLYLRHSRQGTLTLPLAPPVAFGLPFDIGVIAEIGQFAGPLSLEPGGAALDATVVHGEVVADFLRAETPGRWLLVGVGGRYQVGVARDASAALTVDQRVSPMTALSVAFHGERRDGLAAGGVRAEACRRWSSTRGWENAYRLDADVEVTPLAVNDRPLSLFATATAAAGIDSSRPDVIITAGVRFGQPLR